MGLCILYLIGRNDSEGYNNDDENNKCASNVDGSTTYHNGSIRVCQRAEGRGSVRCYSAAVQLWFWGHVRHVLKKTASSEIPPSLF